MLKSLSEVIQLIDQNRCLLPAGDAKILGKLPKGRWIAGTIPYFMAQNGGTIDRERIFVHDLTDVIQTASLTTYDTQTIQRIAQDAPENGFSVLIIPAMSEIHLAYAQNAPNYPDLFMKPILGWISGVHLDDLGKESPQVFNGENGEVTSQKAVVMHCTLAENKMATIGIVNLFKPGKGPAIQFPKGGFQVEDALVDGRKINFAHYLKEMRVDTRLPLVANYCGAMVNISFQAVNTDTGIVSLYAPVFEGVEYHIAEPVENYETAYQKALPQNTKAIFSCNCILNFLYSELEGKSTQGMTGPITFGEIAYQLVNQTLVYLEIKEV